MNKKPLAFPSQRRLKKPSDFKRVFEKPVKSSDAYFTMLALPNACGHSRLGLAIAKKNVRRAVDRNTIKRTVRENFRKQQELGDMDIVVLARREALEVSPDLLVKSLERHWFKLITRCAAYSSP